MSDREREETARIEASLEPEAMASTRRTFLGTAAAVAAAATLATPSVALAKEEKSLAAKVPAGFSPFSQPGKVVRVSKKDTLQANGLYPKADDAKAMLEKKVKEGGVGVWGQIPMPPNSAVPQGDIDQLVTWILTLKK